jgi:hypothetical protein
MGLDIKVVGGEQSTHLTYGGVSKFRLILAQAYYRYLHSVLLQEYSDRTEFSQEEYDEALRTDNRELQRECLYKKLYSLFRPILESRTMQLFGISVETGVNYDALKKLVAADAGLAYSVPGFIGLYKIVYHSDSDGYHSAGDSLDIVTMLNLVKPYLTETLENTDTSEVREMWQQIFEDFISLFNEAVALKTIVRYQ